MAGAIQTNNAFTLSGSQPIAIDGPGAASLMVLGNPKANGAAVFTVAKGTTAAIDGIAISGGNDTQGGSGGGVNNAGTLTLADATVTKNSASAGGGIYNTGTLALASSTISGNTASGGGGIENNNGTVMISGSTLSGNSATAVGRDGGGISNDGLAATTKLTIANSTIAGNSATSGGGISSNDPFSVTGSTFTGNSAAKLGGGIFDSSSLTLSGGTFANNSAGSDGGGIMNAGTLTLTGSTFQGNSAPEGGGIDNNPKPTGFLGTGVAMATITQSAFVGNSGQLGGGIANEGTLTVTNSTLSGNSASKLGGGIGNYGTLTLTNATIAGNQAGGGGGAGLGVNSQVSAKTTLFDTIIAGNFLSPTNTTASDIGGTINVAGSSNNLIGTGGAGGLVGAKNGNLVGVANPGLGTLGNNGGPTPTIPLLPVSPALDAGTNAGIAPGTSKDERGGARITNGTVDIGAFESRGFTLTVLTGTPQAAPVGKAFASPLGVRVSSVDNIPLAGGIVRFTAPTGTGPSATLGASSVTLSSLGVATVAATASTTTGTYTVLAAAGGANTPASFNLTNQTAVAAMGVAWGAAGAAPLVTAADGLRLLPAGRTTDLPWGGINRLTVTLGVPATLAPADVTITSALGLKYGPVTVAGSGSSYTITLAQPIGVADRLTMTIAKSTIAAFTRRLDVLPGDVDDDGAVTAQDAILERNAVLAAITSLIDDTDGDGTVSMADYNLVRLRAGTRLPALG